MPAENLTSTRSLQPTSYSLPNCRFTRSSRVVRIDLNVGTYEKRRIKRFRFGQQFSNSTFREPICTRSCDLQKRPTRSLKAKASYPLVAGSNPAGPRAEKASSTPFFYTQGMAKVAKPKTWSRSRVSNLYLHVPTGTYYARAKAAGRAIELDRLIKQAEQQKS